VQLLTLSLGRHNGIDAATEKALVENLHTLPELCQRVLALDPVIEKYLRLLPTSITHYFLVAASSILLRLREL
jgi:glucosamine--fructose-6-phosphate aminotransferase (isomerizing)